MVEAASLTPAPKVTNTSPAASRDERDEGGFSLWDGDGFSFSDLLDAVNPLQHLPVVGALYRELTGDHIGTVSRLAGGALFAGIPGLIGSAVNAAFEVVTGKDIGETAFAYFFDDTPSPTALAATQLPKTGFGSPLDLALLEGMQEAAQKKDDEKDEAGVAFQTFALRFDRQLGAYEKSKSLALPKASSLNLNA